MLTRLTIRNLALVDSLSVCLENGLNVITGETGAGKSLLIGALRLVLGERADRTMIRTGESTCSVEAAFDLSNPVTINGLLQKAGLSPCEDGQLIIRRQISENASRNVVNDSPVTLALLKQLGDHLVDMHGPYDHQSLLNPSAQLALLDAYAQNRADLEQYDRSWSTFREAEQRVRDLSQLDESGVQEQIDLLEWRIQEVEKAGISEEDEFAVEQEQGQMANAQLILEQAQLATGALTEATEGAAFECLSTARRACLTLQKFIPEATEWAGEIEQAARTAQEISIAIQETIEEIDISPERLQFLDNRLALYRDLKRKYAASIPELLEQLAEWKERLATLQSRDEQRAEAQSERDRALESVLRDGQSLRDRRHAAARHLAEAITSELRDLGFKHGLFDVPLSPCDPGPNGIDTVEFGFAPNAGEAMRPLRAIASSGEISRVMLAVKSVLSHHDPIPLMVFDEIDANVGGEIAHAVGAKLGQLGTAHQIIAITHLPQVAVCGTTHFAVAKMVRKGRTSTLIQPLDGSSRIEEIARMLGGKKSTAITLDHARALLARKGMGTMSGKTPDNR